jgi:parvulin-like peptidyl-prolyl isomerase
VLRAHAADSAQAQRLSRRPFPESRLRQKLPFFAEALGALQEGDTAPVVAAGEQFHVLRLDQRRAAGTAPELAWVAPQIRRRLRIRARKQIYANEVERLRSKAQASGVLDIP